jgi:hypothetical protein
MVLLNEQVTSKKPTLVTYAGAGVIKYFEESLLAATPVGNGNLISATVKGAIGLGIHQFGGEGTIQDMASMAFVIDAVEDGVTALFNGNYLGNAAGLLGGGNATADNWG